VLTVALSYFPELETELELLWSKCNTDLTEGQLDAIWTQTHEASESLTSSIPLLVARDSLRNGLREIKGRPLSLVPVSWDRGHVSPPFWKHNRARRTCMVDRWA
jgi:hypothetical protein